MDDTIRRLKELTDASDNIVFFGGAGVSTESGIPDFRSVDGLYHQKFKYPPETMLSHTFYETHTEEFYDFYRAKMLALDAQPNAAHRKLAEWERQGKLKAVITQNIDGLHQKAGGAINFMPRFFGLSGWVNTPQMSCPSATSRLRDATAKSGVPINRIRITCPLLPRSRTRRRAPPATSVAPRPP